MAQELAKSFLAAEAEKRLYALWEKSGFFNPDNLLLPPDAPTYTIILPPPNITDKLHLGHAAMLAIEDLFIRFQRMRGCRTLWLPGTDHAAIATQTVVEKKLKRETGLGRQDIGRVAFLEKVTEFVSETQGIILNQMRQMGASLDWSRLAFTLDEPRQAAVKEMFVSLHEAGLLYRGERIVNWCPGCQSTLADDEVEYEARTAKLYVFRYDADFPLAIATTRPETKLGDTAVAVNPKDQRYAHLIGQTLTADFCGQALRLKIIADHNVEMDFGTGALGVTPAHSAVDWQMAQVNELPIIKVIDEYGKIKPNFGEFSGLSAGEARQAIVERLRQNGLLIEEEEIDNNLSLCYRCGAAIEPLPSLQWFVDVNKSVERLQGKSLKQAALQAAEGELQFLPPRFKKKYVDWLTNLRDWCVSRQIWFGHAIPAWYRGDEVYVGRQEPAGEGWHADEDTLDTWFSSGMWTFSTLGWPQNLKTIDGRLEKIGDLAKFHPTQLMETGYEIITLWVSRMVMLSYFALGEVPFKQVYLHGMILDGQGKKMSKSKGNGVDPLLVGREYGTDAVRLSLTAGTTAGNDARFSEDKLAANRNFINKLWNIAKFILGQDGQQELIVDQLTLADAWIVSKLEKLKITVTADLERCEFGAAAEALKSFTWNDLADWYIEASKFLSGQSTVAAARYVLLELLKLWHPFIPFVTEEIWQNAATEGLLLVTAWPQPKTDLINEAAEADFEKIRQLIVAVRNVRAENRLEPSQKIPAVVISDKAQVFADNQKLLLSLRTGLSQVDCRLSADMPVDALFAQTDCAKIYLLIKPDYQKEMARLDKELVALGPLIEAVERRLADEQFTANAPLPVVNKERQRLAEWLAQRQSLSEQLAKIKNLL